MDARLNAMPAHSGANGAGVAIESFRTGYIILKLADGGGWKGGLWFAPSYASAYGEDQDLYIAEQIAVDDDGSVEFDDAGNPTYLGVGLLISWSEVEYVEFAEA